MVLKILSSQLLLNSNDAFAMRKYLVVFPLLRGVVKNNQLDCQTNCQTLNREV